MFLYITNATELPHELQTFMIAAAAAADEVNNFSLSEMTYTIPLPVQAPAEIDIFKVHKEIFVQSPQFQ